MPRRKTTTEFPGYVRVGQPNYEVLANLVKKAIGNRSLAEFSEVSGISPSTLSRIINNKFTSPSSDSVIARIIENIDPESGVTREDVLSAHGIAPLLLDAGGEHSGKIDWSRTIVSGSAGSGKSATLIKAIEDSVKASGNTSIVEKVCQEVIQNQLLQQGHSLSLIRKFDIISLDTVHYRADFTFRTDALKEYGIEYWAFDVANTDYRPIMHKLSWVFGTAYLQPLKARGIKMSLVTTDKEQFDDVKERFAGITINDDISVVLVDMTTGNVADEYQIPMTGGGNYKSVLLTEQ